MLFMIGGRGLNTGVVLGKHLKNSTKFYITKRIQSFGYFSISASETEIDVDSFH